MKTIEELIKIIREIEPELSDKYKVKSMAVFGSYARSEQRDNSDVDILVEFSEPVGFEFFDLKEYLETVLNIKVDLVTKAALKPIIKDDVLKEAVFI